MTNHFQFCNAPICMDAETKNVLWYPGEEVCTKVPVSRFQKKQHKINEALKKGTDFHGQCFTKEIIEQDGFIIGTTMGLGEDA